MYCPHYNITMSVPSVILCFLFFSLFSPSLSLQLQTQIPPLIHRSLPPSTQQFQIVQSQSLRYSYSPQTKLKQTYIDSCHVHSAYIQLDVLMKYRTTNIGEEKKYAYHKGENCVYQVTSRSMAQYRVDWKENRVEMIADHATNKNCTKNMLEVSQDKNFFLFSCEAVYSVQASNINTMKQVISHQQQFTSFKILKFQQLIFELSSTQGVRIYTVDFQLNLKQLSSVTHYKNHSLHIADLYYENGQLYILDHKKGMFVYMRNGDQFQENSQFELKIEQSITYKFLAMTMDNLYIAFEGNGQSSVVQCLYTETELLLIRYFKGYNVIYKLAIFQNKLLIQSNSKIDLLLINRDPRMIPSNVNGYSYNHQNQIQQLFWIQNSQFLLTNENTFEIVNLKPQDTTLQCSFVNTGTYSVVLEHQCAYDISEPFYRVCSRIQELKIYVSQSTKDSYHWLVLIFAGVFVLSIVFMIIWREQETRKIKQLFRRIKQLRKKLKVKPNPVEFQEVDHAYSDELHARSRNWSDIAQPELKVEAPSPQKQEKPQSQKSNGKYVQMNEQEDGEVVDTERALNN